MENVHPVDIDPSQNSASDQNTVIPVIYETVSGERRDKKKL